jgi:hypothetical protein
MSTWRKLVLEVSSPKPRSISAVIEKHTSSTFKGSVGKLPMPTNGTVRLPPSRSQQEALMTFSEQAKAAALEAREAANALRVADMGRERQTAHDAFENALKTALPKLKDFRLETQFLDNSTELDYGVLKVEDEFFLLEYTGDHPNSLPADYRLSLIVKTWSEGGVPCLKRKTEYFDSLESFGDLLIAFPDYPQLEGDLFLREDKQ